ncbi:MAG: TRAP transporter TatT component family protein [Myxococcota bacterium]
MLLRLFFTALLALALPGCKSIATNAIADALSGPGNLGSDDDPELIRDAAPFGLKTMESVLESQPEHVGLLTSLASGFTQYAYAFVQQDADAAELDSKFSQSKAGRERAKKLFLRARDYGLRGLELSSPGITEKLKSVRGLPEAVAPLKKEDLPLVYWTAAAWALAISNGKEDMQLVAELPAPGALLTRALELDEGWDDGALHEFAVSYEAARPGGTEATAKAHLDRALALSHGRRLGVQVSWAEGPLVQGQKREDFEKTLKAVLAADANASKPDRLANIIAQRRARLLLDHADDLFN